MHTYFSIDGLITPKELQKKMKEKKIDYACLTDHNVYGSWDKFKHLNVIQGVEKTIKEENGNLFHLLCYFLDSPLKNDDFYEIIDEINEQDALFNCTSL